MSALKPAMALVVAISLFAVSPASAQCRLAALHQPTFGPGGGTALQLAIAGSYLPGDGAGGYAGEVDGALSLGRVRGAVGAGLCDSKLYPDRRSGVLGAALGVRVFGGASSRLALVAQAGIQRYPAGYETHVEVPVLAAVGLRVAERFVAYAGPMWRYQRERGPSLGEARTLSDDRLGAVVGVEAGLLGRLRLNAALAVERVHDPGYEVCGVDGECSGRASQTDWPVAALVRLEGPVAMTLDVINAVR